MLFNHEFFNMIMYQYIILPDVTELSTITNI